MKVNHHQLNHFGEQLMNLSAVLGSISGTAVAYFIFKAIWASWPIIVGCLTTIVTHFLSRYLKKKHP